ncbi:hypothetical protein KUCAC02_035708, partial [Chaenocephalus aceratus]
SNETVPVSILSLFLSATPLTVRRESARGRRRSPLRRAAAEGSVRRPLERLVKHPQRPNDMGRKRDRRETFRNMFPPGSSADTDHKQRLWIRGFRADFVPLRLNSVESPVRTDKDLHSVLHPSPLSASVIRSASQASRRLSST